MSYITRSDLDVPFDVLLQLTDDEGAGSINDEVIAKAITNAEADVDGYAGGRYSLPLSPVTDKVKQLAHDIAVWRLYTRRDFDPPESVKQRYEAAIKFLRDLKDGKAQLAGVTERHQDTDRFGSGGSTTSGNERIFSREDLEDW